MGWVRLLFLGDVGQQMDLDVQAEELRRLREQAAVRRRAFERTDHQLDALRQEHEELKLALAGLVRLLANKAVISDDDVRALVGLVEPASE